jgi:hypothetical protein
MCQERLSSSPLNGADCALDTTYIWTAGGYHVSHTGWNVSHVDICMLLSEQGSTIPLCVVAEAIDGTVAYTATPPLSGVVQCVESGSAVVLFNPIVGLPPRTPPFCGIGYPAHCTQKICQWVIAEWSVIWLSSGVCHVGLYTILLLCWLPPVFPISCSILFPNWYPSIFVKSAFSFHLGYLGVTFLYPHMNVVYRHVWILQSAETIYKPNL